MKPKQELIFWNALGSMLKKWRARGIPPGRALNLLRLWLGYEFTDLMDDEGCFYLKNSNAIRQRMKCASWGQVERDIKASLSFVMFYDAEGKLEKFCSRLWSLQPQQPGKEKAVTNSDAVNNENINKTPQKENNKEKVSSGSVEGVYRDEWADGFAEAYPNLATMEQPLTQEQYLKVLEKGYTNDQIKNKLRRMNNYRKISKYKSVYLTLLDWLK